MRAAAIAVLMCCAASAGAGRRNESSARQIVKAAQAELHGRPTVESAVLGHVRRGESLAVLRSSADGRWLQIDLGGGDMAWVEARALEARFAEPEHRSSLRMRRPTVTQEDPTLNDDGYRRIEGRHDEEEERRVREPVRVQREVREERVEREEPRRRARRESPQAEATLTKAIEPPLPPHGKNYVDVHVRLGLAVPQHRVATNGVSQAVLPAYEYSATNLAAGVQLGYSRAVGRFRFHLDGKYLIATLGAVRYADGTTLSLRDQNFGAGIAFGGFFPVAGGVDFRVRVGAESWMTQITPSAPPLAISSEVMIGMAAGIDLAMPALFRVGGRPFGFRVLGGAIAPATQMQGSGLGTGAKATTYGAYAGGVLMAGLTRPSTRGQVSLEARYDYSMVLSRYTGVCGADAQAIASCRDMSVSDARNGFVSHVATLGVLYQY